MQKLTLKQETIKNLTEKSVKIAGHRATAGFPPIDQTDCIICATKTCNTAFQCPITP